MSTFHRAKTFFEDNRNYIDPSNNQALHNINGGLLAMCEAMMQLQRDVQKIDEKLNRLQSSIR